MNTKKSILSEEDIEFTRWAEETLAAPTLPVGNQVTTHLDDGRCIKCGTLLVMTWMGLKDCTECV